MYKVFEVLEEIGNIDLGDNPYKKFEDNKLKNVYNKEFATLYNTITELKTIKESNPSEALECLERIDKEYASIESDDFDNCFNTIKNYILKAQKLEKENIVLEIIKKKPQAELSLIQLGKIKTYEEYLKYTEQWDSYWWEREYTEEEFNLIKEWSGK